MEEELSKLSQHVTEKKNTIYWNYMEVEQPS